MNRKSDFNLMRVYSGLFLISLLLMYSFCCGQNTDFINPNNFNKIYLEHLVKTGIDSVRKLNNCKILVNDSILYLASEHHSKYMVNTRKLSHTEENSDSTKTPQDRAEFFGAVNYRVGENVLFTHYNSIVVSKNKKQFDTHSYRGLADDIVNGWVHSPGHFKNMITPEYQLTGLSVEIDTSNGLIYVCQKFAVADYRYSFKENKEMFPYSEYTPPEPVNSFDERKMELLENYKYDFKLRHDMQQNCTECNLEILNSPHITLRVEKNSFILRIEDSEFVKNIMDNKYDGFAVGSSRVDLQACKLEYSIVSPK